MTIYICQKATDACRELCPDCTWGWGIDPVHFGYDDHINEILKKSDLEGTTPLTCMRFSDRERRIINIDKYKKTKVFRESKFNFTQES